MRAGLQLLATVTTCVLIPDSRLSFQPSHEQGGTNKHDSVTYLRPSWINVVVVMVDYKGVMATMLIILIAADNVESASAGI